MGTLQLQSFGKTSFVMLQDLEKPQTQIEVYQIEIAYEQLILQTMSTSLEIELTIVQFMMLIL
jgi:hypothetical protein